MTTVTEIKNVSSPTLKPDVLALSDKIYTGLSANVDTTTGVAPSDKDIFKDTLHDTGLPEVVTVELVESIDTHIGKFIAASAHAIGRVGIEAMTANKELKTVETVIKMAGKNQLGLEVERNHVYPNPKNKDEPIEKFGVVSVTYDITADNNSGQLKAARSIIAELGMSALK